MKCIINRKLYDTQTAIVIGECDNGKSPNEKYYLKETLYRKVNGEFFIHKISNLVMGGEEILPINVR